MEDTLGHRVSKELGGLEFVSVESTLFKEYFTIFFEKENPVFIERVAEIIKDYYEKGGYEIKRSNRFLWRAQKKNESIVIYIYASIFSNTVLVNVVDNV